MAFSSGGAYTTTNDSSNGTPLNASRAGNSATRQRPVGNGSPGVSYTALYTHGRPVPRPSARPRPDTLTTEETTERPARTALLGYSSKLAPKRPIGPEPGSSIRPRYHPPYPSQLPRLPDPERALQRLAGNVSWLKAPARRESRA